MSRLVCSRCASDEFVRLEHLITDAAGRLSHGDDANTFKCGNCGQKISANEHGDVTVIDTATAPSPMYRGRVMSSVSSTDRNQRSRPGPRRDPDTGF
jgi:hypothetical protein